MISYSAKSVRALAFLKRPYNDIDVFVEDLSGQNIWISLLRRVLPPHVKLTSVNRLGSRSSVISACRHDQGPSKRPKVYLIDGDFDHILGRRKPRLKFLYRFRAYCLENVLVSEAAIMQIAVASRPSTPEADLAAQISFGAWMQKIYSKLRPLFLVYAVTNKLAPSIRTIDFSPKNLLLGDGRGEDLCEVKIRNRCRAVLREARKICDFRKLSFLVHSLKPSSGRLAPHLWISGKHYILPLLHLYLQRKVGLRLEIDSMKVVMAQNWDERSEIRFANMMKRIAP